MKRIIISVVMVGIMAFSAFAGANQQQNTATSNTSPTITMRLLTDASGVDDRSFNAAAWRGILEFYGDTWTNQRQRGRLYDVIVAQTQDMYLPNLRMATDHAYDLIAATGFTFADPVTQVARTNPNQKYMIIDVGWVNLPNVLGVVFTEHEGSYLVGVAAALKAQADGIQNPKFGFIGGVPSATITKFQVGFVQGVLSIIPNAEILDYYVNSWAEPALAKTQAKAWYDSGVYAIYSAAGSSGNGTIAEAKEQRFAGKNVWAIGVDSDQHEEGIFRGTESAVLTSMLKRVETSLLYGLRAVQAGTFRGQVITLDLKADGVGYSTTNSALTPAIRTRVEEVKQRIISGNVKVAATYAEARRLSGFPQNLKAIDD